MFTYIFLDLISISIHSTLCQREIYIYIELLNPHNIKVDAVLGKIHSNAGWKK